MAYAPNSIWWHPSGPGPVNPNTYGPRQPQTAGGSSSTPGGGSVGLTTPFAFMPAAGSPPPSWLPRSLGGTGGVLPPKPAAKGVVAKKASPLSPMDMLMKSLYAQIETPQQQEARIKRMLDEQMGAQQKLIDNEYERQRQDAMMQFQAQAAAGAAAAAMSKDLFGAVGGEFNSAAGEIKGLSHGLTKAAGGATAKDVAAANKGLAETGNMAVQEGGVFGVAGPTQTGVEDYRAGTLGGQLFQGQGEAANFGLAGMLSSGNLRATQEAQAALGVSMHDIRANQAKAIDALVAGRADLAHTYLNEAKDSQIKTISLIQGMMAQKEASASSASKTATKNALDLAKLKISAGHLSLSEKSLLNSMKGQNFQQQMATTREARLSDASRIRLENAALNQQLALGKVDVNASKAAGWIKRADGSFMLDGKGQKIPSARLWKPAAAAKGKTLTPNQLSGIMTKAQQKVNEMFYGVVSTPGGKLVSANLSPGFEEGKTWGKGQVNYVEALKTLTRMKVPRGAALDMLNQHYLRGEDRRPFLSNVERARAVKQFGSTRVDSLLMRLRQQLAGGGQPNQQILNALLGQGPLPAGV